MRRSTPPSRRAALLLMLVSAIALAGDEPASREPDAIARLRIEPAD